MVSSKVGPESFNYFWQTMELEKLMEFFTTKLLSCHWHYFKIIKSGKSEKRGKILVLVTSWMELESQKGHFSSKKCLKMLFQIFHRGTPFVEANVANALLTEILKDCHQVSKYPVKKFLSSHKIK